MRTSHNIKRFFKGFSYAFGGIISCIKTERNMRFHLGAAVIVAALSVICRLSASENAVLFLTVGVVMSIEAVNTAVESAVDLAAKGERSHFAKKAKDAAAGAVLISAVAALGVAFEIFCKKERLKIIWNFFCSNPAAVLIAAVFLCIWILFVLKTGNDNNKDKE